MKCEHPKHLIDHKKFYKVVIKSSTKPAIWCGECTKEFQSQILGIYPIDFSKMKPKEVCFYSHTYKEFVDELGQVRADVMRYKASKFIENRCLDYSPDTKEFFVKPIKGYNSRTYSLKQENGLWSCNCQGAVTKKKRGEFVSCSHLLSLKLAFKMSYFDKKTQIPKKETHFDL